MLLLYLQPLRTASIHIGNAQIGNAQIGNALARSADLCQKSRLESPPALAKSAEPDCQPEVSGQPEISGQPEVSCREILQHIDRTTQRYFWERRLFL